VSYILDALKKSEQERSRGTIPDIKAIHRPAAIEPKKNSRWPYVLLIVLLLNAAGLGVWIYQQNRQTTALNSQTSEQQGVGGSDTASHESSQSTDGNFSGQGHELTQAQTPHNGGNVQQQLEQKLAALETEAENNQTSNPQSDSEKSKSQVSKTQVSKTQVSKNQVSKNQGSKNKSALPSSSAKPNVIFSDEPLSVSTTELKNAETVDAHADLSDVNIIPEVEVSTRQVVDERIYEIAELPDDVKRELPAISFAGHVYSSTKSQRSVMLNGKKMREGQEVSKGLMLEEITLEGVVLRAQGYRFKLGALQDWSFP
jgi:cytoskeletal protein RodZ